MKSLIPIHQLKNPLIYKLRSYADIQTQVTEKC